MVGVPAPEARRQQCREGRVAAGLQRAPREAAREVVVRGDAVEGVADDCHVLDARMRGGGCVGRRRTGVRQLRTEPSRVGDEGVVGLGEEQGLDVRRPGPERDEGLIWVRTDGFEMGGLVGRGWAPDQAMVQWDVLARDTSHHVEKCLILQL